MANFTIDSLLSNRSLDASQSLPAECRPEHGLALPKNLAIQSFKCDALENLAESKLAEKSAHASNFLNSLLTTAGIPIYALHTSILPNGLMGGGPSAFTPIGSPFFGTVLPSSAHPYNLFPAHHHTLLAASHYTNGKRKRRHRTIFSEEQLQILETTFLSTRYPDVGVREKLALQCDLKEERVEVWFKNRRAKERKKSRDAIALSATVLSKGGGRMRSSVNGSSADDGNNVGRESDESFSSEGEDEGGETEEADEKPAVHTPTPVINDPPLEEARNQSLKRKLAVVSVERTRPHLGNSKHRKIDCATNESKPLRLARPNTKAVHSFAAD